MNLIQCTNLEGSYREMRLAKDKSNSMHKEHNDEFNCSRQGTKREFQSVQDKCDKRNRCGQLQGSKEPGSKDSGWT